MSYIHNPSGVRYSGQRDRFGTVRSVDMVEQSVGGLDPYVTPLPLHLEVFNYSPTGFEWGYGGAGPTQLAFAILFNAISREDNWDTTRAKVLAPKLAHDFRREVVGCFPHDGGFDIYYEQVLGWIESTQVRNWSAV